MSQQKPQTCITSAPRQAQTHDKRHPSTQYKSQATKLYGCKETSTLRYHSHCSSSTPNIQLSVCVCVCQRMTKDRAYGMRKKVLIPLDEIRACISGIRAHRASDCTTTAGTPPVSRNKHFRHSPVSSIVKQSCMKHSNSSLHRYAKHRTSAESDEACQRKTKLRYINFRRGHTRGEARLKS